MPATDRPAPPSPRRRAGLAVFLVTVAVSGLSVATRPQLGPLGGLTDEWHPLGANLAVYGVLGMDREPWVLRPPGYPAFVALVLKASGPPAVSTAAWRAEVRPLVYGAHAVLLAAAATLLFAWLSSWLRTDIAFAAALVFGVNPLAVAWVGLLHYTTLHLLGLVAATWALQWAFREPRRAVRLAAAGALLGLVTLVRPVTLVLPPLVLAALLLRLRGSLGPALRAAAVLTAAMAAVILPWTARNWAVSGRFIPVNLQAGVVFWAATEKPLPWDPDHYLWFEVADELLRVHARVTGASRYDIVTFTRRLPELEAEYRREALLNLRRQPFVYARNVARVLWAVAAQTSTSLARAFVRLGGDGAPDVARAAWFRRGAGDEVGSPGLGLALRAFFGALTALAAVGLLLGVRARDEALLGPVTLLAAVALAHALTHLDLLHHYVRVPFVVVLAFYALDRLARRGTLSGPAARGVALSLAAASVALTAWVILS